MRIDEALFTQITSNAAVSALVSAGIAGLLRQPGRPGRSGGPTSPDAGRPADEHSALALAER